MSIRVIDDRDNSFDWTEIKVNGSLYRKITRSKMGNGRGFSKYQYNDTILEGGPMALFLNLSGDILPSSRNPSKEKIKVKADKDTVQAMNHIEKHLRMGGTVGFNNNLCQFTMGIIREVLKLQDHEELRKFCRRYERADIKDTGDLINFLQEFIDNREVSDG